MKKNNIILLLVIPLYLFLTGCLGNTTEPEEREVTIDIKHSFGDTSLNLMENYSDPSGRPLWITTFKYYLSNLTLVDANGNKNLVKDIVLVDLADQLTWRVKGKVAVGDYTRISIDLGVREDLNKADPATYPSDHPLSVMHDMYWSWSTQYIFSKSEGKIIEDSDTLSWFIHAGTQDLYRPDILIPQNITVGDGDNIYAINLDFKKVLNGPVVLNFAKDGQSHTTDNLPLATNFMDNFAHAFN